MAYTKRCSRCKTVDYRPDRQPPSGISDDTSELRQYSEACTLFNCTTLDAKFLASSHEDKGQTNEA